MKNKKNIIITVSIIAVILGVLALNILDKPKEKETPTVENKNILKDSSTIEALFAYSGTYMKNNYIIAINVTSKENVDITVTDGQRFSTLTLELDKDNNLVNQEDLMEIEKVNLQIIKVEKGIEVKSSSEVEDSIFNDISGEYTEETLEDKDWSGYYTNAEHDISVIIDECSQGTLYLAIDSIHFTNYLSEYDEEKIVIEDLGSNDNSKLTITKTQDGIEISFNKKGDQYIFNQITGIYTKEK